MLLQLMFLLLFLTACGSDKDTATETALVPTVDSEGLTTETPTDPIADAYKAVTDALKSSTQGQTWAGLPADSLSKLTYIDNPHAGSRTVTAGLKTFDVTFCKGTTTIASYYVEGDLVELYDDCDYLIYNERDKLTLGANLYDSLSEQAALYAKSITEYSNLTLGNTVYIGKIVPNSSPTVFEFTISYDLCANNNIRSISSNGVATSDNGACQ